MAKECANKYVCKVCGYVYEPKAIGPEGHLKPFEELSDDWSCPECGAGKEQFEAQE